MPEISRFLGIVITMHYGDHAPPHFHARYAGRKATLSIQPLESFTATCLLGSSGSSSIGQPGIL